jgi:hypothetical protein
MSGGASLKGRRDTGGPVWACTIGHLDPIAGAPPGPHRHSSGAVESLCDAAAQRDNARICARLLCELGANACATGTR